MLDWDIIVYHAYEADKLWTVWCGSTMGYL